MRFALPLLLLLAALSALSSEARIVRAAALSVDSTVDAVDAAPGDGVCATAAGECTLRAAVQEANALPGADTITIPAGTYLLTIAGADEAAGASGDLDIHEAVTITGAGMGVTILDGAGIDRVLDVGTGATDPIALTIRDLTIQNGLAPGNSNGGGLVIGRGDVVIERVAFRRNEATTNGGGLATGTVGSLEIRDAFFVENVADGAGGGFFAQVDTTVSNTQVLDNTAAHAGGIRLNDASLTIFASTVARNTANGTGGIGIFRNGDLIATNVTVSDNVSGTTGVGAGISVPGDASVLTHVTIVDNRVGFGIGQNNNTITLRNSIVANNGQQDCAQARLTLVHEGQNLDSDGTCGAGLTADPALAALGYWGGPAGMQTRALGSLSPAIDAAPNCLVNVDERGESRPQQAACDLGAYEASPAASQEMDFPIGFSTLGWFGGAISPQEAFGDNPQVEGVWAWDPVDQRFLSWFAALPDALNSLKTLSPGTGLWLRLLDGAGVTAPTVGEGDVFLTGDAIGSVFVPADLVAPGAGCAVQRRTLEPGFNLVAWEGGTTPAADALGDIGAVLQGTWRWDALAGAYETYVPSLPPALNSLTEIRPGQALWIRVSQRIELAGPAAC